MIKKNLVQKNFGPKKIIGPKKFLDQKKFKTKIFFGPKKFLDQKKIWNKKNFGPKNLNRAITQVIALSNCAIALVIAHY